MVIRQAKLDDLPQLMELIREIVPLMNAAGNWQWDSTYPNTAVFENDINMGQLWIAEIEGVVAGVAAITTDQEPEYAQLGWDINETAIVTHRLAVSKKHQGKGIAANLLRQAENIALSRKIGLLRIDTNTMNEATQRLFPKLGYVFSGEIGLSFRPGLRFYGYEKQLKIQ